MIPVNTLNVANNEGGLHVSTLQSFVFAGGNLVSVEGTSIDSHPDFESPHVIGEAFTANADSFWTINGIPVSRDGEAATCGHPNEDGLGWLQSD